MEYLSNNNNTFYIVKHCVSYGVGGGKVGSGPSNDLLMVL